MQLHCVKSGGARISQASSSSNSCVVCPPGLALVRRKKGSRHEPAKLPHSSLSIVERQAAWKACQPVRSLMWDGSGGDMTLSEQLLSLREQDSMDEEDGPMATVNFHLRYKTNFGQGVKLIGSDPKLGNWDIGHALEMRYTPGDTWVASVELAAGGVYEYKYVIINYETKEALEWQNGSNAVLAIIMDDTEVEVFDNWGNNPGAMVRINNESITREGKLQRWAGYMGGFWKEAKRLQGELMQKNGENQGLRNELSQLRMELSLEQQARTEVMSQMKELKVENAGLKNRLAQKTVELNKTLTEVLDMLDAGMLDGDDVLNMNGDVGSSEEDEDAQWLSQRGLGVGHGSSSSSSSSSDDYGSRFYNNDYRDVSSSYSSRNVYGDNEYGDNSWNDNSWNDNSWNGGGNDYGNNNIGGVEYNSSSSSSSEYGDSNGDYQSRPSDILFGEVAAEGQGMGEPEKPLVGWEADAEAQARAAELEQLEQQRSGSAGYSSWRSGEQEEVPSSSTLGSARQGASW